METPKEETNKGKEKKPEEKVSKKNELDSYGIIKYPLSTEKSLRLMESENRLIFIVDKKATKEQIKKAIEEIFKVKVVKVNTAITQDSCKRAYVKFSDETPAIDIATNMGLM